MGPGERRGEGRAEPTGPGRRTLLTWVAIWIATRFLIVAQVGFWAGTHLNLQDVGTYETWSHIITDNSALPGGHAWQYPPGAAFLMLLPRLGPGTYGESFVALMLLVDLAGLGLLARLGRSSGNYTGVWVWLLGVPLLGVLPVLRFDLVPAVIAIAGLVVIHRRPHWFGALAGLGAAIKVWPIVLLFGEWERRRLIASLLAAPGSSRLRLPDLDGRLRRLLRLPFPAGRSLSPPSSSAPERRAWHVRPGS